MTPVIITQGNSPIVLGMPHGGTFIPDVIRAGLNKRGLGLDDTDWHIDQLYDGLLPGATTVQATFHRYVIDANRDPSGQSLYPGQNTTGLCPLTDFDGHSIYLPGQEPGADEIADRAARYHAPYHAALLAEVARVRALHGVAILWDCHSIRSTIPFLFDGLLPIFNIGTNSGATCATRLETAVHDACAETGLPMVLNGRFKGGWTTRHYGQPDLGVHAIQMELAQRAYLTAEKDPWSFDQTVASPARAALAKALKSIDEIARSGALTRLEIRHEHRLE